MKKILIKLMAMSLTSLLMVLAFAGAASASSYIFHEPQVPAKLRK